MLLKKTSSSWSLSKSAAMTVRTGDGMENLGVAMSCGGGWARGDNGHGERDTRSYFGASGPLLAGNWGSKPNQGEASHPPPQPKRLSSKASSGGGGWGCVPALTRNRTRPGAPLCR